MPAPPPKYDPEGLAETLAGALVAGNGTIRQHHSIGPVTNKDRRLFQRVAGESVERFNERLTQELGRISEKVLAVITAKLESDQFKTGELAYLFAVIADKKQTMEGRAQITNAAINIQVNQYGSDMSKAELIEIMAGKRNAALPGEAKPVQKVG